MSSLERKYDDIVKVEMGIKEEIIVATVVLCLTFSSWGRPMSFLQLYEMKFGEYGCCHICSIWKQEIWLRKTLFVVIIVI